MKQATALPAWAKVGTVLHYSWGWEQTNCEFYEVVAVRGSQVIIREIAAKQVGPWAFMSTYVVPEPGKFIGPEMRKKAQDFGVRMKFGTAGPISPEELAAGRSFYCSWYA